MDRITFESTDVLPSVSQLQSTQMNKHKIQSSYLILSSTMVFSKSKTKLKTPQPVLGRSLGSQYNITNIQTITPETIQQS